MKKLMMIALGAGLILGGCSSDEPSGTTPAAAPKIELSAAQSRAAADMEAFNLNIFRFTNSTKEPGDVVVCSPVQTLIAYSLFSYMGQSPEVLHGLIGCDDQEALNELSHTYLTTLPTLDPKVKNDFASLWVRQHDDARDEIEQTLRDYYGTEMMDFDPEENKEDYLKRLGAWHEAQNCDGWWFGVPGYEKPHEDIYFTNYFEGEWAQEFDESKTVPAKFDRLDGRTLDMQLMHNEEMPGRYMLTDSYVAAAIDLGAGAYEAIFVLPHEKTIEALNKLIDSPALEELFSAKMDSTILDISLPRTDCYGHTILAETNPENGVKEYLASPIYSSIEFTEKGAKSTTRNATSGVDKYILWSPGATTFTIDRPYLAFIRLKQTGICLAAAKVTIPSCEQRDLGMIRGTWEK